MNKLSDSPPPEPPRHSLRDQLRSVALLAYLLSACALALCGLAMMITAKGAIFGPARSFAMTVVKFYGTFSLAALACTVLFRALWRDPRRTSLIWRPSLRAYRFSLRALLVTTTVIAMVMACFVSYHRWARERKEFLDVAGAVRGHKRTVQGYSSKIRSPYLKWLLFGDHDVIYMNLYPDTFDDAYLAELQQLFPEAEIISSSDSNAVPKRKRSVAITP